MKRVLLLLGLLSISVVVRAQNPLSCGEILSIADNFYNKGNYINARRAYKLINKDNCDEKTVKYAQKRWAECNEIVTEGEDYGKCKTVAACDYYIENHPQGKHIDEVKNMRAKMIADANKDIINRQAEDEAYAKCDNEDACNYYLRKYPNGRYVSQVRAIRARFAAERSANEAEDRAYSQCYTEEACREYLRQYPNGKYASEVKGLIADYENERVAERSAYMNILWVDFENTDESNNVIQSSDNVLYSTDIKFIVPKIEYDGLVNIKKHVTISYKIYRPNGELMKGSSSPAGYTRSDSFWVKTGYYNSEELSGWGNRKGGVYAPGEYRFEIWYDGIMLYKTTFTVYERENDLTLGAWRDALKLCSENVTNQYNDSFYKGTKLDGSRTGLGMYGWANGAYYIGNWSGGDMNGLGINFTADGYNVDYCPKCMYFVGRFTSDQKNGEGSCYDKYGNLIYNGSFINNKPVGTYPMTGYDNYKFECIEYGDGYYVGETRNGVPEGKGFYIWDDGDLFYGGWVNGLRDGAGIMMMYDGAISNGTWKEGEKQ